MKQEVLNKLEELKKYVGFLREYQKHRKGELKENAMLKGAVERYLQLALECVIDIGQMIIAKEGFRKPEKYRDVILILGKNNILPLEFAEKFSPSAGFRNILVHAYSIVDLDELYNHLQNDLEDFDIFARHVAEYARKKN